jgi:hypothetical protein
LYDSDAKKVLAIGGEQLSGTQDRETWQAFWTQ